MTTYAIGSVNGYYQPLLKLLEIIQFDKGKDSLWFTGNLVNTGPESPAVLRFVKNLGKSAWLVWKGKAVRTKMLTRGYP